MADYRGLLNYNGIDDPENVIPSALGLFDDGKGDLMQLLRAAERNPLHARGPRVQPGANARPGPQTAYQDKPNFWGGLGIQLRDAGTKASSLYQDAIAEASPVYQGAVNLVSDTMSDVGNTIDAVNRRRNFKERNELNPIVPQGEKKPLVEAPPTAKNLVTPDTTIKDLHEIQVAAKRKEQADNNAAIATTTREKLISQGATEEQLSGWDKFTDEYDLGTIGAALLATSNSGDIWSNLGTALIAGRQQRIADQDREDTKYDRQLSQMFAAWKNERDDALAQGKLGDYASSASRRENQTAVDKARLGLGAESNAIDWYKAYTGRYKALAEQQGVKWDTSNETLKSYAREAAKKSGVKLSEFSGLEEDQVLDALSGLISTELKTNKGGTDYRTAASQALQHFMKGYTDSGFLFGTEYTPKTAK